MRDAIRHYFARRRLRTVVAVLPFALAERYGNSEFYTASQAGIAIVTLKIKPALMPYALIVALAEDDAARLDPSLTPVRCAALRQEIVEAFDLPEGDFTSADLRATLKSRSRIRSSSPAPDSYS
jgi:hypothetical protein